MHDLLDRDLVRLAGPVVDAGGEALVVMEGESEASLRQLLADDPWCRDRDILRVGRIRGWRIFLDATARLAASASMGEARRPRTRPGLGLT